MGVRKKDVKTLKSSSVGITQLSLMEKKKVKLKADNLFGEMKKKMKQLHWNSVSKHHIKSLPTGIQIMTVHKKNQEEEENVSFYHS